MTMDGEPLYESVVQYITDDAAEAVYTTAKESGNMPDVIDVVSDTIDRFLYELAYFIERRRGQICSDTIGKVDGWLENDGNKE